MDTNASGQPVDAADAAGRHVHSTDGSTFLRKITIMAAILKV